MIELMGRTFSAALAALAMLATSPAWAQGGPPADFRADVVPAVADAQILLPTVP